MGLKVSKKTLSWMVTLIIFIPFTFSNFFARAELTTALEFIRIVIFFAFILKNGLKKSDFSILICVFLIYQLSYLVPAIVYGNITLRIFYLWIKNTTITFAYMLIVQRYLMMDYQRTIKALYYGFALVLVAHSILGITTDILLIGIRTRFTDFYIPAITLLAVSIVGGMKSFSILDLIFCIITAFFIFDQAISTSLMILIIFVAVILIGKNRFIMSNLEKIFQYPVMVLSALILNVSILVFRIQNIFAYVIENILHESLSMTGRTTIWDQTFAALYTHNIFLGAGIQPEGSKDIHFHLYNVWDDNLLTDRQAHNQLLSVFFFNGVIGLIAYIAMIFIAGTKLKSLSNRSVAFFYVLGIFLICLSMITELSADGAVFLGFLLCIYYSYLLNNEEDVENEY